MASSKSLQPSSASDVSDSGAAAEEVGEVKVEGDVEVERRRRRGAKGGGGAHRRDGGGRVRWREAEEERESREEVEKVDTDHRQEEGGARQGCRITRRMAGDPVVVVV